MDWSTLLFCLNQDLLDYWITMIAESASGYGQSHESSFRPFLTIAALQAPRRTFWKARRLPLLLPRWLLVLMHPQGGILPGRLPLGRRTGCGGEARLSGCCVLLQRPV